MKANVEKLENNKVKLEIEVAAEEFDEALKRSYFKTRGNITIPGFRKGKAPRKVIESYYGEGVFYEDAINETIPTVYDEAVEENQLFPVDMPEFDIVQIGQGQNFIFTAEVTVKPEVELGQYKGIEINRVEYNVTDQDIDDALEALRQQNARWISVEDREAKEGDLLTLDYKGYVDGEAFEGGTADNQTLEIGSGHFIPGFEEQLIGMNLGDEKEITVTFPEEYHSKDLAGKDAIFAVKVHEIKEKELPELDDEFIKDISEFDTVEEYKEDSRKAMEEEAKGKQKTQMEDQLLKKIVENAKIDIPEVMVETEIDSNLREMDMNMRYQGMDLDTYLGIMGMSMETLRDQFKDSAYDRVKLQLTLEQIIKEEAIEASDEDVEDEYLKIAEEYKVDVEEVKSNFVGREEGLKNSLALQKVVEFLMEQAVILDVQEESQEAEESEEPMEGSEVLVEEA